MIVVVRIAEWVLDEDQAEVRVGDRFDDWLIFTEHARYAVPPEQLQRLQAVARPLPPWGLSAEPNRHPVRLDIGRAVAYWDAPTPVSGTLSVTGSLELNRIDAPNDFPTTVGTIRRVRMEWQGYRHFGGGDWEVNGKPARYEDLAASHLPSAAASAPRRHGRSWTSVLVDVEVNSA